MPRSNTTVIKREKRRKSVWTGLVLLISTVCGFAIFALFLAYDHATTDRLLSYMPSPRGSSSLAADTGLASQVRTRDAHARLTRLSDQSTALVVLAEVVNESAIPLSRVVIEAALVTSRGNSITARSECGKVVSDTLLNRLSPDEVATLLDIPVPAKVTLAPGASMACQIALPGVDSSAHEVELRIASVEPLPGHPRSHPRPWE